MRRLCELCEVIAKGVCDESPKSWVNGVYVTLSHDIFSCTGVLISPSTLKRVFGKVSVEADYDPQIETKNALAQYAGFENWSDFSLQNSDAELESLPVKVKSKRKYWLFILLLISVFFGVIYFSPKAVVGEGNFVVSVDKSEGIFPHTAIFRIEGENIPHNAMLVIEEDTIPITGNMESYSHFFKLPGYVIAKVFEGEQLKQTIPISIYSDGWSGYAHSEFGTHKIIPSGTLSQNIFLNYRGDYFFTDDDIQSFGFPKNKFFMTEYRYFEDMDFAIDNMEMSVKIKSGGDVSAIFCDHIAINLHCDDDYLGALHFVNRGCSRWAEISMGEKKITGMESNLDFMSQDFSYFREVKLTIKSSVMTLYIDDKELFSSPFDTKLGYLHGVSLHFTGLGQFADLSIENDDKQLVINSPKSD